MNIIRISCIIITSAILAAAIYLLFLSPPAPRKAPSGQVQTGEVFAEGAETAFYRRDLLAFYADNSCCK